MSTPSWHLKLRRAKERLAELNGLLTDYDRVRPYAIRRDIQEKRKEHRVVKSEVVFSIWAHEEPDPWIAVIVGDLLANVRSALDHLASALVPRSRRLQTQFPIFTEDFWTGIQADGPNLEAHIRSRRLWDQYTRGIAPAALSYIDDIQPFRRPNVEDNALAILARLHNADKHRELIPVVNGLAATSVRLIHANGLVTELVRTPGTVRKHGAVAARLPSIAGPSVMDVKMEAEGTLKVAIGGSQRGLYALPSVCETILGYVKGTVIPDLEVLTPTI